MFSTDGTLVCASAVPRRGDFRAQFLHRRTINEQNASPENVLFASNLGSELVMCLSAHEYCKKINEKKYFHLRMRLLLKSREREMCVFLCVSVSVCVHKNAEEKYI